MSRARRDEDFDALLDAADRFGGPRDDDLRWLLGEEPLPRRERREQERLERKPIKPIDPSQARRVKIDD